MKPRLLLGMALFSSCSLFHKGTEEAGAESIRPRLVGRIASRPAGEDFVLIEVYGNWRVPDGGMVLSFGSDGRSANLLVTGERSAQYIAADIRSGLAKVGDSVYYRAVKDEAEGPASVESSLPVAASPEIKTQKDPVTTPAKP